VISDTALELLKRMNVIDHDRILESGLHSSELFAIGELREHRLAMGTWAGQEYSYTITHKGRACLNE